MPRSTTVSRRPRQDEDYEDREESRSRRRPRDEDEERPARRSQAPERSSISRGRDGLRKHRESHQGSGFPNSFSVPEDKKIVIRFLQDDFFVTYYQHWLDDSPVKTKGFICLGEEECPLCQVGDKPRFFALINVLDFTKRKAPEVKVWFASADPATRIEEMMDDETSSPVNRADLYFVVSKAKKRNGFFEYRIEKVKARDLEEDYDILPLDEDELEDWESNLSDESFLRVATRRELLEIAEEIAE